MNTLLKENHVKYGLIMTALTAVWVVLMHVTGVYTQPEGDSVINLIFIVISPLIVWYLAIKAYKKLRNNKLTFNEGVKEGFQISVVYGLTSPFIFALYYLIFNQEIVNLLREEYNILTVPVGMVIFADMVVQFVTTLIGGTLYGVLVTIFHYTKPEKRTAKSAS